MTTKKSLDIIILPPGYLEGLRNMRSIAATLAELLLSVVPLVVLTLVTMSVGSESKHHTSLLAKPDWSFLSAVLFGQTLVKFVSGAASLAGGARWERIALMVALLFLFGVVPSLVLLVVVLIVEPLSLWVLIAQLVLFILACASFFVVGAVGRSMLTTGDLKTNAE